MPGFGRVAQFGIINKMVGMDPEQSSSHHIMHTISGYINETKVN